MLTVDRFVPLAATTAPMDCDHPAEDLDQVLSAAVIVLFAEVDAILCAAASPLIPRCPPPAPPVSGCAHFRFGWPVSAAARSSARFLRRGSRPHPAARAVSRSPPPAARIQRRTPRR